MHVKIVNKIQRLEHAQYGFLDHSKALDFSDLLTESEVITGKSQTEALMY